MKLEIKSQMPSAGDISKIVADTKNFPYLTYVGLRSWRLFDGYYSAYLDGSFAGVLAVNKIGSWVKLGPLVILAKFHGKGVATALIKKALILEKGRIYLASANPSVWKIAQKLGFQESFTWITTPLAVKMIYLKMSVRVLLCGDALLFIKEVFRKQRLANVHNHRHFVLKRIQLLPTLT